ncbi:MAG: isochorismatase family cysteine hydrolase [Bacillota bacterium]
MAQTELNISAAELKIDTERTALVILHYQNDIVKQGGAIADLYWKRIKDAGTVEKTKSVLEASRKHGVLVVFVECAFRPGAPELALKAPPLWKALKDSGGLIRGTKGAATIDELKPLPEEPVCIQASTNGFWGTDLEIILRAHAITDVVLTGIATAHFVILSTTLAASDMGFYPIVLEDCCNDESDEYHNWIINNILADCAVISDSTNFIKALDQA